mgnify:CR=1 FL=1
MPIDLLLEFDDSLEADDRAIAEGADLPALTRVLEDEALAGDIELTVLLGGPALLRALNHEHRGLDEPTDVLSFPAAEGEEFPVAPGEPRYLGDIAVSVATVRENAAAASLAADLELRHVVVHGMLHLAGYDHETPEDDAVMRAREETVLGAGIHAGRGDEAHSDHD